MTTVVSIAAALKVDDRDAEACPEVQLVEHAGECEEDHPLKWLQPTPEISVPVALYLPPARRLSSVDAEARSSMWNDSTSFPSEAEQGLEALSAAGSGASLEPAMPPPPASPYISTTLAAALPPPAHSALEEEQPLPGMDWQTPSPTCAFAATFPLQAFATFAPQQVRHPRELAPTLLEAVGSFASLGDWSTTCEAGWGFTAVGLQVVAGFEQEEKFPLLASVGSAEHVSGKCKPCAFFYRPVGCADGQACSFCHICEPGERKRRQKEKFQKVQQRRLRRAQVTSTESSSAEVMACTRSSLPTTISTAARLVGAAMPR